MTYRDPTRSIQERVDDLLGRMSLDEKTAQLGSVFASDLLDGDRIDNGALVEAAADGIGQVTRLAGRTSLRRRDIAHAANLIQRHLIEQTRLGIPAIVHEECLAGYMAVDATIFPQALGLAASWRPELAREVARSIATQMRLAGAHIGLAPVLDIGRDPRWGRLEETLGEDPFLTSVMGLAAVEGLQHDSDGTGIVATAKHFVGHGVPEGGRNAATPHIPRRELAEVFMAPFEQVVRHGNVGSVMHAYHDLDGVPCIANRELLTELLRGDWGFGGIVVSDYNGIQELHEAHRVASSLEDAAAIAIAAGLDVELPETSAFGDPLRSAVRSGRIDEEVVDRAVARVLTKKLELGLFERPEVDVSQVGDAEVEAKRLADEAASASLVLLQNRGAMLPLSDDARIALIGPHAADARALVGDYAHVVHQELLSEQRDSIERLDGPVPADLRLQTEIEGIPSLLDAMIASGLEVTHAKGCDVTGTDRSNFDAAVDAANQCDVAVVVLGDRSGLTAECTSGESRDRVDIALPGAQQDLLEAVVATGTPVVLILLSGRPNAVPWAAEHVAAIIWAILPGQAGGAAITDALRGRREPRGRLPVTVARHVGQIPIHYQHNPSSFSSRWRDDYVEADHRPLWHFGHGLGYTTFDVDVVGAPQTAVTTDQAVRVKLRVQNTGARRGATVVQIYAEQSAASVVRPAQRLIAFRDVDLDADATTELELDVPLGRLALINQQYERVVEPGTIDLAIGLSCADIRARVPLDLIGATLPVHVPPPAR